MGNGLFAHEGAIASEDGLFGAHTIWGSEAEPDEADGFFIATTIGTCDAGNRDGEVGIEQSANAGGHLGGDFGTDGADAFQVGGGDAENIALNIVGIADDAAGKDGTGAGDGGDGAADSAAGAAFGGGTSEAIRLQEGDEILSDVRHRRPPRNPFSGQYHIL